MMIRVETNEHHADMRWWSQAFLTRVTCPPACRSLILGMLRDWEVTVPEADAEAFKAWGEKLPGWTSGPAYAPHPFVFSPAS